MNAEINTKFGELLKSAREEKNISLAQVSEALKISVERIGFIEASDIHALPPAAFTSGYLKLYSKLVEADEKQVLDSYYQISGEKSVNDSLLTTSDMPQQANSKHPGMRIISFSLIIFGILLIVLWWQDRSEDKVATGLPATEMPEVINSELNEQKQVVETEAVESIPDENKIETTPKEIADTVTVTEEDLDDQAPKNNQSDETGNPAEEKEVQEVVETLTVDTVSVTDDSDEADKVIELARQASPVAETGNDDVLLIAKDDCWIEISDANDHLLYFSLLKKNEQVELKGQQPFKVFLGKAEAVDIIFNGIEYDVSEYIRSNQVARFTMTMEKALEMQLQ